MNVDLNLLPVFAAVYAERSVTRAAQRLHLSQPAVSHALGRLRDALGDELFVRTPRGVVPTPRAESLAPRVEAVLASARALAEEVPFDAAVATGVLRLASSEYFEELCLPRLVPALRAAAPGVVLVSTSAGGRLPAEDMERGRVDLAVAGFFGALPEGFHRRPLFEDPFVGVARPGHPILAGVTLDRYLAAEHLLISPEGRTTGPVDRALEAHGTRRVVATVGNFLTPASVLAASDLVATVPARLAQTWGRLATFPLPFPIDPVRVVAVWHERVDRDPLQRWFRDCAQRAATVEPAG